MSAGQPAAGPFSLPADLFGDRVAGRLFGLAAPWLERALALSRLNRMYAALPPPGGPAFVDRALAALDISLDVAAADVTRIPASGPLVVVANHPHGAADGLVLLSLVRRVRPDVKAIGNFLLKAVPEVGSDIFAVDPFGGRSASARSRRGLRQALRWLEDGGAVVVFPAGAVARFSLRDGGIVDPTWSSAAARLARRSGATALPVFVEGRNRTWVELAGALHPALRTALLPRALLDLRGGVMRLRAGAPIPPERLRALPDAATATAYLRARTYLLAGRETPSPRPGKAGIGAGAAAFGARVGTRGRNGPSPAKEPIVDAVPPARLEREIDRLTAEQRLLSSGPFDVLVFQGDALPETLREIGRLREIAFRLAGEGTGRALDRDRFDDTYLHLFLWNRERSEIAGAYRIGPTDVILPRCGERGLYTSTLFRYRGPLLRRLDPALELGRSFVRPEYQRTHSALTLLWRGIGAFIVRHPRYRRLFGPVSISGTYGSMTRQLLVAFLQVTRRLEDLGRLVRPRHPARFDRPHGFDPRLLGTVVRDLDEVDGLVREIETDRGMPVLLRHYLKLNARLLGWSVDPRFGDVLDGLLLIDLLEVDRTILARFMGREGAAAFARHHGESGEDKPRAAG